jgi:hypothetical protein
MSVWTRRLNSQRPRRSLGGGANGGSLPRCDVAFSGSRMEAMLDERQGPRLVAQDKEQLGASHR